MSGPLLEGPVTSGLEERLKGLACELRFGEPLAPFTTFQVGGPADALALPKKESDLEEAIERCRQEELPITLLGGGALSVTLAVAAKAEPPRAYAERLM